VEGSDPTKPLFSPISRNPAEKFQTLFKLVGAPTARRPRHGPATPACRFDEIPHAQGCKRPSGSAGMSENPLTALKNTVCKIFC